MKKFEEARFPGEVMSLYERLRQGEGREEVNERNVAQLMRLAERDGHTVLHEELREWRAN